jgi:type IV fimbrial biogenesis protein FimT
MSQQAPRRARVPIHRASSGFTVVELCVTLAVASVVLAVGIPSLKSFSATNRMATEVNQLLTHLRLARSEAVKRTERIALCPSDDGASTAPAK